MAISKILAPTNSKFLFVSFGILFSIYTPGNLDLSTHNDQ
ncbi:uncharacterized protein METZ01_LOCUS144228 [marine metagenome]|uniref:Uncharacterized protein n=1 Tax=marine metagenome TaxID=408172 RepID=A0A381ZQH3_9ZZZZ